MQSCQSKNVHTGTGLIKAQAKGSVSASNGMAENHPKTSSSSSSNATPKVSCKIENILSPNVVIKPENDKLAEKQNHSNGGGSVKPHESHYDYPSLNLKMLDTSPELISSPARGSTGLQMQIPSVQHEAVQPSENGDNHRKRANKALHQHQITPLSIYQTAFMGKRRCSSECTSSIEFIFYFTGNIDTLPQFKQEYPEIKKEADTSSEKDFEEINMGFRIVNPNKVKQEKPDKQPEKQDVEKSPVPTVVEEEEEEEEVNTVNLINESGDESVTTTTFKRKANDSSDDVIELSDNSILDPPLAPATVKRRKLLEKPISTPKKSPPNSYKSLIKQSNNAAAFSSGIAQTAKSKLISPTSTINKSTIRRKNIFKARAAFKTMRFAASKAKRRALKKKKKAAMVVECSSEKSSSTNDENVEPIEDDEDEKLSDVAEESVTTDPAEEHHEERSMDGSSECSGKSNIDLTIERVAKGYFSESEIFSSLAKHRKTKSQKKFETKLLDLCAKRKEKKKKEKALKKKPEVVQEVTTDKSKKKKKKKEKTTVVVQATPPVVEKKVNKAKKSKAKEEPPKEVPSSHSTPKKKAQKPPKIAKKAESPVIESDDDVTIATAATKDEDTSTTLISSTKTETPPAPTTPAKPLLDETDVANNNDEYFKDNNQRQKQHEPLTLYKTPGYGWTMALNKSSNKRGKKAKYTKTKKLKVTLPNDIVIPKSTSIPRWSNGWVWEGEPYQALVFLNVS